ncbi:MAG: hypothetical protein JF632_07865 [Acidobacteria bacterium]|nr:hypothetical protein [Acidobacteriota bacterium]
MHVERGPAGAQIDGVSRKRWIAPRVEGGIRTKGPDVVVQIAKINGAAGCVHADTKQLGELPLGPPLQLDTLIVDLEMGILTVPDAKTAEQTAHGAALESTLRFEGCAFRAPPRQRYPSA